MTLPERTRTHFSADDPVAIGVPGAEGRWQPTRAGAVNSWAWADETLLFADGWLALAGPNGSGKSLTASMLITVLLDAETTQTALSVSGKASGTLTSRHTDRNEREDRTGAWWLEYGLRDASAGRTEYLTTGLWLRSTGSELQRAFFIAPGRIGRDLLLRRDREAVRITDLTDQLVALGGEVFTSSSALRPHVTARLQSVGDEREFRQAVRTRLFAPLDEVQFDALIGVLRSLRSVRTAEAISPAKMREVLTEALPALEPDQLKLIAEAMERIAELENQLGRARTEARLLNDAHRSYSRYLNAVAQLQAAELSSANKVYGDQTGLAREATQKRESAEAAKKLAEERLTATRELVSRLEGESSAAETVLREHAGAELPLLERRADELSDAANEAEARSQEAATSADSAAEQAQESADTALEGQHHLSRLTETLRQDSVELGAESAFDRFLAILRDLGTVQAPAFPPPLDLPQLSSTPLAWAEARTEQIRQVQEALLQHSESQATERTAARSRRDAEDAETAARDAAEGAAQARTRAESDLHNALHTWAEPLRQLTPPPPGLSDPESQVADERLSPDAVRTWLVSAAAEARNRIDLTGHQQQAKTDAALAGRADRTAADARAGHAVAFARAGKAAQRFQRISEEVEAQSQAAQQRDTRAHEDHSEELAAAQAFVETARGRHAGAAAAAAQAARDWLVEAHRWRASLVLLRPAAIGLPGPVGHVSVGELETLDPAAVRLAAHAAHAAAVPELHDRVARARDKVRRAAHDIDALKVDLARARQATPAPDAPSWRDRSAEDGVPLWALVNFADHLSVQDADRLEGALLVSGLLDALVTPDGRLAAGDLVITARPPATGPTLADVLRPEHRPDMGVDQIRRILRAIPLDTSTGHDLGALTHGVLTASCPTDYRASFIGRTARERARQQRIARLEEQLAGLEHELADAQATLADRERSVTVAATERDTLPGAEPLLTARDQLARLAAGLTIAERQAAHRGTQADLALHKIMAVLDREASERATRLKEEETALHHAEQAAEAADEKAAQAESDAAELARAAAASEAARVRAAAAQSEAEAEHARFPAVSLTAVIAAHQAEDRATDDLSRARTTVIDVSEQHRKATGTVKEALRTLNNAAGLPDGSLLPTSRGPLDEHMRAVSSLIRGIDRCCAAAQRCTDLIRHAHQYQRTAADRTSAADNAADASTKARLAATNARAHLRKTRELHGAEYQELLRSHQTLADQLQEARAEVERLILDRQSAGEEAAAARTTLAGIAPQRANAERHRDHCLHLLNRLIDERLATLPSDLPADPAGRPANLTAGLTWARRLLADRPAGPERLATLVQNRNRALAALERSVRTASTALARFNRQVVLVTIEDTEWRRAVIAEPDSIRGDDLDQALQGLHASITQLEEDLRDDVKQTPKTGMFTKLRRDIQVRREAARELVRQIRATLREVRTGVANVGVQVDWDVRKDEDAQRMIDLITRKASEETFDQMYTVLRQRMDETVGEPWPDRVAHTFDYRAWHEWDISVTHSSFGDGTTEVFKKVSPRSNPLESLSTGERRLATMLPLLAAAWSMYSGDAYHGPRLLSIDEIDAAFDEPNLRQVLGLLRSWDFDVLATTPSISPMIKREAGRAVVHEVLAAGRQRITVPWLWEGHGEPRPLTLDLDTSS